MVTRRKPAFQSFLGYHVTTTCDALRRAAALYYQREHGLSLAQWRVLVLIDVMEPLRLRDLASRIEADKGQVSRIVSSLSALGLLERRAHARDGRSTQLALSPAGKTLAASIARSALERDSTLRACLTAAEVEQFTALLVRVKAQAMEMLDLEERLSGMERR